VSQFLITVDDALRALAEARSPEQLIDLANTAETLRRYAQRARLGMAAQNRCAELRLRAERKLGQYLVDTPRNSGGRPKPVPLGNGFPTLDDLGITRKLSHRAQRLAAIPAKDFDWYLRTAADCPNESRPSRPDEILLHQNLPFAPLKEVFFTDKQ
jgi:hypothetical protein